MCQLQLHRVRCDCAFSAHSLLLLLPAVCCCHLLVHSPHLLRRGEKERSSAPDASRWQNQTSRARARMGAVTLQESCAHPSPVCMVLQGAVAGMYACTASCALLAVHAVCCSQDNRVAFLAERGDSAVLAQARTVRSDGRSSLSYGVSAVRPDEAARTDMKH